ncbi:unnamed protein product [Angiostrongylus costaricensis]|uniref:Secreted protein n=1 Tax=Angiostrongylus costaricensis TaxID=334426 RepID=A0A0R3PZB8_ANGCS|nr:unnamed protein product [Angiostrongylus costaricensis]
MAPPPFYAISVSVLLIKVCSRCPTFSDVAAIPCMVPEARVAKNEVDALSLDNCPSVGSPPPSAPMRHRSPSGDFAHVLSDAPPIRG